MTECIKCGDCCELIPFKYNKKEIKEILRNNKTLDNDNIESLTFIEKNWVRVNKKESSDRNKEIFGYPVGRKGYLYKCLKFDIDKRECGAYTDRPPVCSGYPWYNKDPDDTMGLPIRCSFREDIPIEIRV